MAELPVRDVVPAHRFDEARLAAWMAANVEGYVPPLRVQQFQGGASNPTFLLTAGDERPVAAALRRMAAMRVFMRGRHVEGIENEAVLQKVMTDLSHQAQAHGTAQK